MRSLTHPVLEPWRRPASIVLAVLTACFLVASATGARTDLAARDHALQTMIDALPPSARTITTAEAYGLFAGQVMAQVAAESAAPTGSVGSGQIATAIDQQDQAAYTAVSSAAGAVPIAPFADAWVSVGTPTYVVDQSMQTDGAISAKSPRIQFTYLEHYQQHAHLVSGHWPEKLNRLTSGRFSIEVAMSTAVLQQFHLHLGSEFLARSPGDFPPPPIEIVVTGAYQSTDPESAYWQDDPSTLAPQPYPTGPNTSALLGTALLGQDELAELATSNPFVQQQLTVVSHVPLQVEALNADQVAVYAATLASTLSQASGNLAGVSAGAGFQAPMLATLARFQAEQQAGQLETAMPAVSLALLGLIALLVAARSVVDRTDAQTRVMRSRGAPLWRMTAASLRDAAVTVLPPALAAGLVIAWTPGRSPARLWEFESVLPLTALIAPAVITVLRYRHRRSAASTISGRIALARRIAPQAALAALCLFGLDQARAQGLSSGGRINLLTASAPALAACLLAMLMLNLGPLALRVLLRTVSRRRGAIGLLGIARTARTPAPAAATVVILTAALAIADLTVALRRTSGKEGATGAASQAIYQVAQYTGTDTYKNPSIYGSDALAASTADYLGLLAIVAVATGCLVVALATVLEARERRTVLARLSTMGLTPGQARGVTAVELLGPIALAAVGGSLAAPVVLWAVRPALSQALGGVTAQISTLTLAEPVAALALLALLAGLAAAGAARRGVAGTLRLGELTEGA